MPVITIDKRNFLRGQSTTVYLSDGGYSPDSIIETGRDSDNVGLLTWGRAYAESSTNIAGIVQASALGYRGSSFFRYSIDGSGRLYETNVSTFTHTVKYTESTKTYNSYSSILSFKDKLYITSTTDIYRESYSFTENDENWWTGTLAKTALTAGVPHILFEYNDLMYITNGNKVWSTDGTTGNTTGFNTLSITDDWIIYQVLTKGDEIYLFAAFKQISSQFQTYQKIFVWDGYSESWNREINLPVGRVFSVTNTINGLFFATSTGLYAFDGYNYSIIPNIRNILYMVPRGKDLFYTDDSYIYRYDLLYKAVYKIGNKPSSDPITHIFYDYHQIISIFTQGATTSKYFTYSFNSAATPSFFTNYYEFETPVWLRKVEILFSGTTPVSTNYSLYIRGELDQELQSIPITTVGIMKWQKNVNHHVDKFRLQLFSNYAGNRTPTWIKIYYEPSERSNNK